MRITSSDGGGKLDYFVDFDVTDGFGNQPNEVFAANLVGGSEIFTVRSPKMR